MKRGAKLNRRQIGVREVMGRKEVRTGSEQGRDRGREGRREERGHSVVMKPSLT